MARSVFYMRCLLFFFTFQTLTLSADEQKTTPSPEPEIKQEAIQAYLKHIEQTFISYDIFKFIPSGSQHLKDPQSWQEFRQEVSPLILKAREKEIALLLDMKKQEDNFPADCVVFNAQDSLSFAYQVVAKELYEKIEEKEFSNFEFLSHPSSPILTSNQEFFEKYPCFYSTQQESFTLAALEKNARAIDIIESKIEDKFEDNTRHEIDDVEKFIKAIIVSEFHIPFAGLFEKEIKEWIALKEKERQLIDQLKIAVAEEIEELEKNQSTAFSTKRIELLHKWSNYLSAERKKKERAWQKLTSYVEESCQESSQQLIEVSLAMESAIGDSAFSTFIRGCKIWKIDEKREEDLVQRLEELFEAANISPSSYKPYLKELASTAPKTEQGIVNQIFIPRARLHEFFLQSVLSSYQFFLPFIPVYQYLVFPAVLGLCPQDNEYLVNLFDSFEQERLSPDFDIYKRHEKGCLIADTLLDEDVKIFRYTLIPQEEQDAYQAKVKTIIEKILKKENKN